MNEESAMVLAPFGAIRVSASYGVLMGIDVLPAHALLDAGERGFASADSLLKEVGDQILRYLEDPQLRFALPNRLEGTPFQERIWQALREIPAGKVVSYGGLAQRLDTGSRAVASACKANRFPILIPCHRVVSGKGVGGYCGETEGAMPEIKRWLLRHEGALPGVNGDGSV